MPNDFPKWLLRRLTHGRVASGPFAGLRYVDHSVGSAYGAKLLGTYERELGELIRTILRRSWALVVDVGAAEGYYAVGFARFACNNPRIIAFEREPDGQMAMREMAAANSVLDRIDIRGSCDQAALAESVDEGVEPLLVICDVEGFEDVLLDPERVRGLRHAFVLVEVHDAFVAGVGDRLRDRFAATHSLTRIDALERTAADFPNGLVWAPFAPAKLRRRLLPEHRPSGMYWYWFEPRAQPAREDHMPSPGPHAPDAT